jgi:hypothetical protein
MTAETPQKVKMAHSAAARQAESLCGLDVRELPEMAVER